MLYVKLRYGRSMIVTITKTVVNKDGLIKELEEEALRLQREIEKIQNRQKRELAQRVYNKVISRIAEIRNPSLLKLTRYE